MRSHRRRRVVNGGLAILLGFGASWTAFRASDYVTADEARGSLLGDLDFRRYCRLEHGERADVMHTRTDARGWHCAYSVNGQFRLPEIDVDAACGTLYSGATYAANADMTDPYGWHCYRGPRP